MSLQKLGRDQKTLHSEQREPKAAYQAGCLLALLGLVAVAIFIRVVRGPAANA